MSQQHPINDPTTNLIPGYTQHTLANTNTINTGNITFPQHTIAAPQHQVVQYPSTYVPDPTFTTQLDPWTCPIQVEGLDELCDLLGVEEGGTGMMLVSTSGVRYSLQRIIQAQVELMVRLNVLLVHRRLVPESTERPTPSA